MCILISELSYFYIFCMYKKYFCEIMSPPIPPPSSEGPVQVNHLT